MEYRDQRRNYGMNHNSRSSSSESQEIANMAERLNRKHRTLRSKFIRFSVAMVIIMVVLMVGGFLGMWYIMDRSVTSRKKMETSPFCVPCKDLTTKTDNIEEIKKLFPSKEQEVCCASDANSMHELLVKFFQIQTQSQVQKEAAAVAPQVSNNENNNPPFITAGAHLIRKKPGSKDSEPRNILTSWNDNAEGTFRRNVSLLHGHLVIQKPGFYSIYSQVSFSKSLTEVGGEKSQNNVPVFEHSVHRRLEKGNDKTLLKASKTMSDPINENVIYHTSYLSGVFELKENEEVFVKVNDIRSIHHNLHSTYFGLFRVF